MFLKYPLLVKDRESFNSAARRMKVVLGDWFVSPLHPVEGELNKWFFDTAKFPVASRLAKCLVNLPTDVKDNSDVIRFLEININNIY